MIFELFVEFVVKSPFNSPEIFAQRIFVPRLY